MTQRDKIRILNKIIPAYKNRMGIKSKIIFHLVRGTGKEKNTYAACFNYPKKPNCYGILFNTLLLNDICMLFKAATHELYHIKTAESRNLKIKDLNKIKKDEKNAVDFSCKELRKLVKFSLQKV